VRPCNTQPKRALLMHFNTIFGKISRGLFFFDAPCRCSGQFSRGRARLCDGSPSWPISLRVLPPSHQLIKPLPSPPLPGPDQSLPSRIDRSVKKSMLDRATQLAHPQRALSKFYSPTNNETTQRNAVMFYRTTRNVT